MGYTHYFYRNEVEHDAETFAEFVTDVKTAYKRLPATAGSSGGYYNDKPLKIAGGKNKEKRVAFMPTFLAAMKPLAVSTPVTRPSGPRRMAVTGQFWMMSTPRAAAARA